MFNKISKLYDRLIDKNIDITNLWIYHRVINSDAAIGETEDHIEKICSQIRWNYDNDNYYRTLDKHIDIVINNQENSYEEEWD